MIFILAFLVGIYSYCIFVLGIVGWLYKDLIVWFTIVFIGVCLLWSRRGIIREIRGIEKILKKEKKFFLLFSILFFSQGLVNLMGTLGPELGFDALWYHLTLPKIYLEQHAISFIPGGLLYYSGMPKLAEMLYVAGLSFGNEVTVKLIHFSFGLLTCLALYKLQRKFFGPLIASIGVVIFYSSLVVAWESASAYIDLVRTFFEVMALWGFVNWWENQKQKWLFISALLVGLAITTKLLAVGSLIIFSLLIIYYCLTHKKRFSDLFIRLFVYLFIALLVPLPWFIFSFIHTGNPLYPLFSQHLMHLNNKIFDVNLLSPIHFISTSWNTLTQAADPISPLYLIFLPLIILLVFNKTIKYRYIFVYSLLGFDVWYLTSQVEGTRMLLPYLPAFSFLCAAVIHESLNQKKRDNSLFAWILIFLVIFVSLFSIAYRLVANAKYIPVLMGKQSKSEFLSDHLVFSFADFYDIDGYFNNNIKSTDTVLLYGFHNLYYIDFPYIDSSWVKKGDTFNYVATQKAEPPERFKDWKIVYKNDKIMVKLYRPPDGVCDNKCSY